MSSHGGILAAPDEVIRFLTDSPQTDVLILDLRVFNQYSQSRLRGALNLCIPTTLLKRPSYGVDKLAESFRSRQNDRAKFDSWRTAKIIIVYDVASWTLTQAAACVNIIQKFTGEKWQGAAYIIKGGFKAFADKFPDSIDNRSADEMNHHDDTKLSIDTPGLSSLAGGCSMPADNAMKPFFNNIRQNMDLIGGVGQIPIRLPKAMTDAQIGKLPNWLRTASDPVNEGKIVSDLFLDIEKNEQARMQKALSSGTSDTPKSRSHSRNPSNGVRLAGIGKGDKNRYKDILPFEHSRVRSKMHESLGDYINASHIKSNFARGQFIACQAPTPATFEDLWRVVWEQKSRLIVMLTAESEGGQLKAHPYWTSGDYGDFRVKLLNEEDRALYSDDKPKIQRTSSNAGPSQKPQMHRRHTDIPEKEPLRVNIRLLELQNTSHSNLAPIQITQVQLCSWPDTGTTVRPADILSLIDLCNDVEHQYRPELTKGPLSPNEDYGPKIVHCSAGCGRTGTFCTVAVVLDILKKEAQATIGGPDIDMDRLSENDEKDLIAQTVAELRLCRMSMVQTLRQFVLCYEAILEWYLSEHEKKRID